MDLHNQMISGIPMTDPDELEDILINAADKLTDGNEPIVLEALMNVLVDYYIFTLEPGDDEQDIGFLVSNIEDRVCNAIAFRNTLIDNGLYDTSEIEVGPITEKDIEQINAKFGITNPADDSNDEEDYDDENDDLPYPIDSDRYIKIVDTPLGKVKRYMIRCPKCSETSQESNASDPDDIRDKEIPGMMKRFESEGFEITVKMVPKKEFD